MNICPVVWVTLLAASPFHPALAQSAAPEPRTAQTPKATDARKPVAPTVYRSVFDTHRASGDDTVISWREANDLVGRIGGWRVYAREAQSSESPTPAAAPVPSRPSYPHR